MVKQLDITPNSRVSLRCWKLLQFSETMTGRLGKFLCCVLRVPGRERNVSVVPGGMELELQVKMGSWAGCTHSQ